MKIKIMIFPIVTAICWFCGFATITNLVCEADISAQTNLERRPVFLDQRIYWVGVQGPSAADLSQLDSLLSTVHESRSDSGMAIIEQFISQNPGSGWTYSLKNVLGENYLKKAQFTAALSTWEEVWQATKQYGSGSEGKKVADFALANWTRLLATLGRYDTLTEVFQETKGRVLQLGPLEQKFRRTKEAYADMRKRPGISYRCGTIAMANICPIFNGTNGNYQALLQVQSSTNGFTIGQLEVFSRQFNLGLVAVRLDESAELIVPSVVNWKQHHYAAIVGLRNGRYKVVDATMELPRFLTADEIKSEASGYYLVPASQMSSDSFAITQSEANSIYGKGNPNFINDIDDQPYHLCHFPIGPGPEPTKPGPTGSGPIGSLSSSCTQCGATSSVAGMPEWGISEPYVSLWLQDEPMGYQPAYGPKVSFQIYYRDRVESAYGNLGSWTSEWLQTVEARYSGDIMILSLPGGGQSWFEYSVLGSRDYHNNNYMISSTNLIGQVVHSEVWLPDGSKNIYDMQSSSYGQTDYLLYLSKKIDPQGNALTFYYQDPDPYTHQLLYVVDATGLTNTLFWQIEDATYYLTNVTDPFGRSVNLQYDASTASLTNITDVAGLSSSISYASSDGVDYGLPTSFTTPYGSTWFTNLDGVDPSGNFQRAIIVTEPTLGNHLYCYSEGQIIPSTYPTYSIPTNTPLNTLSTDPFSEDTFYWGPREYSLLSTAFLSSFNSDLLTTNDLLRSRLRHWLGNGIHTGGSGSYTAVVDTLALEQAPSPDGNTLGQVTWFDHDNKVNYFDPVNNQGSQILPAITARVMPDASTYYIWDQRNVWGLVTNEITHWLENGQDQFRTNSFFCSTNGIDIIEEIRPDGITNTTSRYDANHRILNNTNAAGEITRYTYDGYERLTSITRPSGWVTTNFYGSDGFLAQQIDIGYATNSYTYLTNLIYSHTDSRGLTTTNTWDNLNRLTGVIFPDGSSISNQYTFLDITATKDRMGYWTHFGYDAMRRKTAETNAIGFFTLYNYCTCGALDSMQDAVGNVTYYYYDNAGRLTSMVYPDSYTISRIYDPLDRMIKTTDTSGNNLTNNFNNHGFIASIYNTSGKVAGYNYDVNDLVTNSIDANGVSRNATYDILRRVLTRSYPDNGVERWSYTPNFSSPTSYTNQITNIMVYAYDAMNRKTNEIYIGVTTNKLSYNGASDLLTLTDGKNDNTTWKYDQFGRITNKLDNLGTNLFVYQYDLDNRLTNRWSAAKASTTYKYDAVGNLTNVIYPVSAQIKLRYDPLNRLTNMVDGIGTTIYGYDAAGQLLSEGGLWPNDTVNYTYANRLRIGLSLLAPNASAWTEGYAYDNARRLTSLTSPAGTFGYFYDPAKLQRLDELTLPNGACITNTYDNVARLLSTKLLNSTATILDSQNYGLNMASQRIAETNTVGDYRNYLYDNEGELTSALGKEAGGVTNRLQEQLTYGYDAAGNVQNVTNNGFVKNFTVNSLNELTQIGRTGNLTVAGTTTSAATNVTVNTTNAVLYADHTFAAPGMVLTSGIYYFTYSAIAKDIYGRVDTNTITAGAALHPSYTYDLNGNLLAESGATTNNRSFAYNDENELTSVYVTNIWRSDFMYDGKMRRRIEKDYAWNGSSWTQTNEVRYIYDGNVVVQERDTNNLPLVIYTRGNDLSGTLQGAGGIGGLLARTDNSQLILGSSSAHAYYHADGNGNVTAMINNLQLIVAKYLYDPFGNTLSLSGPLATANTYRFSSKEWNDNAGLYYYLYRFYDPNLQRWLNRDPLGERGFVQMHTRLNQYQIAYETLKPSSSIQNLALQLQTGRKIKALLTPAEISQRPNLYVFVFNDPIRRLDLLGLSAPPDCEVIASARRIRDACRKHDEPDVLDCVSYCNYVVGNAGVDAIDTCENGCETCGRRPLPTFPPP
jgi:RHS repeat-associated protein